MIPKLKVIIVIKRLVVQISLRNYSRKFTSPCIYSMKMLNLVTVKTLEEIQFVPLSDSTPNFNLSLVKLEITTTFFNIMRCGHMTVEVCLAKLVIFISSRFRLDQYGSLTLTTSFNLFTKKIYWSTLRRVMKCFGALTSSFLISGLNILESSTTSWTC